MMATRAFVLGSTSLGPLHSPTPRLPGEQTQGKSGSSCPGTHVSGRTPVGLHVGDHEQVYQGHGHAHPPPAQRGLSPAGWAGSLAVTAAASSKQPMWVANEGQGVSYSGHVSTGLVDRRVLRSPARGCPAHRLSLAGLESRGAWRQREGRLHREPEFRSGGKAGSLPVPLWAAKGIQVRGHGTFWKAS